MAQSLLYMLRCPRCFQLALHRGRRHWLSAFHCQGCIQLEALADRWRGARLSWCGLSEKAQHCTAAVLHSQGTKVREAGNESNDGERCSHHALLGRGGIGPLL
jgi:hypothetical protein